MDLFVTSRLGGLHSLVRLFNHTIWLLIIFKYKPTKSNWLGRFESYLVANPKRQVFLRQGSYYSIVVVPALLWHDVGPQLSLRPFVRPSINSHQSIHPGLTNYKRYSVHIWATSWENVFFFFLPYANNKDADQHAYWWTFVVRCLLRNIFSKEAFLVSQHYETPSYKYYIIIM